MAGYPKAVSAMVSEEARGYIDQEAVRADTGVGDVIRRLIDRGIRAEQVTDAMRHLGLLDEEDDVLSNAARTMRAALRARGRVDVPTMEPAAPVEPAIRTGFASPKPVRADHVAGETPRPSDAGPDTEWHPDPAVRAQRARAARRRGADDAG